LGFSSLDFGIGSSFIGWSLIGGRVEQSSVTIFPMLRHHLVPPRPSPPPPPPPVPPPSPQPSSSYITCYPYPFFSFLFLLILLSREVWVCRSDWLGFHFFKFLPYFSFWCSVTPPSDLLSFFLSFFFVSVSFFLGQRQNQNFLITDLQASYSSDPGLGYPMQCLVSQLLSDNPWTMSIPKSFFFSFSLCTLS
jgi:hypothetical protein